MLDGSGKQFASRQNEIITEEYILQAASTVWRNSVGRYTDITVWRIGGEW